MSKCQGNVAGPAPHVPLVCIPLLAALVLLAVHRALSVAQNICHAVKSIAGHILHVALPPLYYGDFVQASAALKFTELDGKAPRLVLYGEHGRMLRGTVSTT